jgi:hypothetical protein
MFGTTSCPSVVVTTGVNVADKHCTHASCTCEERGHISVKGIAYPVATYQVVDTYENLGTERLFIHEERPNLRLDLDLDAMSADDRGHAATVLREALDRLSALDRATTPGRQETKQSRPPGTARPKAG